MRIRIRWAAMAVLLACSISMLVPARGAEISHDQHLEDFADLLADTAARIEQAAVASQRAGDAGLAQRQFLVESMIKRAGAEIHYLQQPALKSPIRDLAPSEVAKIDDLLNLIAHIEYSDKTKIVATTAAAQARVGALVDAMANGRNYPILYGMLARDLMDAPDSAPADIEIFGHDVVDPREGKTPAIRVGGAEIPAKLISMKGDDILVDLPDATKDLTGFSPTPCRPRNAFTVRATAYYGERHGIWPIRWVSVLESNSDFTALPSSRVYEFSVSYNYERTENTISTERFTNRSTYVVAACGQTVPTSVSYQAPAGAHDLSCEVSWAEASGAKAATKSCAIKDGVVEARGALTGPDKLCSPDNVCGCVASARGWLQIDGGFQKDNIAVLTKTASLPDKHEIVPNDSTSVPLELDPGSTLRHIGVIVNRRACPTIFARLDIQFSDDGHPITAGVSRSGAFRANYENKQLTIVNATTESAEGADSSN